MEYQWIECHSIELRLCGLDNPLCFKFVSLWRSVVMETKDIYFVLW